MKFKTKTIPLLAAPNHVKFSLPPMSLYTNLCFEYCARFIFLLTLLVAQPAHGQYETAQWHFGGNCTIDFLASPPSAAGSSTIYAPEGCASIADDDGNLLLYTNGITIWNQQHAVMDNGTGLMGNQSSTQSSVILKKPGTSMIFYVFTLNLQGSFPGNSGLRYSIVDMTLAAGLGSVTVKNVPVFVPVPTVGTEKIVATRHCNGIDYWILTHEYQSTVFRAYKLTASGFDTAAPVLSAIGSNHGNAPAGQMKFSPSGKKLAVGLYGTSYDVELFDFDIATGVVSNSMTLPAQGPYGVEFSANGSKLYCSDYLSGLIQFDLCAGSPSAIAASKFTLSNNPVIRSLQLGIDGKVYAAIPGNGGFLGVVNKPEVAGPACNYVEKGKLVSFSPAQVVGWGLPNFASSLIKAPITYSQDLACQTVSFSPPSIAIPSLAGCPAVANVPVSVSWDFGDPASGAQNTSTVTYPVHNYSSLGSYKVRLVISYASCAPDTIYKFVNVITPSISLVTTSVSCDSFATASVTVFGGSGSYNYTWTPGNHNAAVVHGLSPGNHSITVQNKGGVCAHTFTINIPQPAVISAALTNTRSCNSVTAQVSLTNGSGHYSYAWLPSSFSGSLASGLSPGNYSVSVWDSVYQCAVTRTLSVPAYSVPALNVTGNTTICPGQSASLTVSGAHSYTWSTGDTASAVIFSPAATTAYTVTGTDSVTQCAGQKVVLVVPSDCLMIPEEADFPAFGPNPVADILTVRALQPWKGTIYDLHGRILSLHVSDNGTLTLDTSHLQQGIYNLVLETGNKRRTIRFIK